MAEARTVMATDPLPWVELGLQVWEMWLVAPSVLTLRAVRLLRGGWPPHAGQRAEYTRMVNEKVVAAVEVGNGVLSGGLVPVRAAAAAIGPVHRTLMANYRRLSGL